MRDEYLIQVLVPRLENNVGQWVARRTSILIQNWDAELQHAAGTGADDIRALLEAVTQLNEDVEDAFLQSERLNAMRKREVDVAGGAD